METFVIRPASTPRQGADKVVFQDRGVPHRRTAVDAGGVVSVSGGATSASPSAPAPAPASAPASAPPPPSHVPPRPPAYRSSRAKDTRLWMHDATCQLVDALLTPDVPKATASSWLGVLDVDFATQLERQRLRETRAAQALQASIEASAAERAIELAAERDRCLAASQQAADEIDAIADRCVDAIDAAMHEATAVRTSTRRGRRDVEDMRRSLDRLCAPRAYHAWAPRIRTILDEEASTAYERLGRQTEAGVAGVHRRRPASVAAASRVAVASNAHLQTLLDAADAGQKLRALQKLTDAVVRAAPLVASCAMCDGPNHPCASCKGGAS